MNDRRKTSRQVNEKDLLLILDISPNAELVIDQDGTVTNANDKCLRLFGYSREAFVGLDVNGLVRGLPLKRFGDLGPGERASTDPGPDTYIFKKDGGEIPVEIGVSQIETHARNLFLASIVDVSRRKQSEEAAKRSEGRYRLLFDSNPLPMWVYDIGTLSFIEVNDAAIRHYGYARDEFLSMKISDIRPEEDSEALRRAVASISSEFGDRSLWRHRKKDGTVISVEVSAHSIDFDGRPARLVLANDISEKKGLEDQLRQSQKMEAIGLLAGGIAHDFNNLLTAINGYCELSLRLISEDNARLRSHLSEIYRAGIRAASLTRQLLAFGRKQRLEIRTLDLNEVVEDLAKMLKRLIGEHIDLKIHLRSGLRRVDADLGQIEQMILNLVLNARDAMPSGGTLTIETENVEFDEEGANGLIEVGSGDYVRLAVSDTGTGMTEEVKSRIFEPFFSTKELGKGTGLGLSTTYGIVRQSGGSIWVESEPGAGSSFKICLPARSVSGSLSISQSDSMAELRGDESILLVEDEKFVRDLAKQVLESAGYKVMAAVDANHALTKVADSKCTIDLLLTDMVMPSMGGHELAVRVRDMRAETKILIMSGYTDHSVFAPGLDIDAVFLQKPFSASGLLRKVREALDGDGPDL